MIRDLQATDGAALSRFFAANNVPDVTKHFHPFPLNEASVEKICLELNQDQFFGFFSEGRIIGLGMLRGWQEGFVVPSFGLLVDYRAAGRGIGTSLTAHAVQRARDLGCPAVRLTVHSDNESAIRLYRRAGFEPIETLPDGRVVMRIEFR